MLLHTDDGALKTKSVHQRQATWLALRRPCACLHLLCSHYIITHVAWQSDLRPCKQRHAKELYKQTEENRERGKGREGGGEILKQTEIET